MVLLAGITALGSLAIHLFVPAMPRAALALRTNASAVQFAVTIYLLGIAIGQVISGPVSDAVGRRPVLFAGLALFAVGSAVCWTAVEIEQLLVGRFVEAMGGAAGLVISRSIAGDSGSRSARDMALLQAIVMLSPMLAPVLGGILSETFGWRSVFAVLTIASLPCAFFAMRAVPKAAGKPLPSGNIFSGIRQVVTHWHFLRHLFLGTAISAGLYVFLTASPFLLTQYYRASPSHLGFYYGAVAMGAAMGALSAGKLSARMSLPAVMRLGAAIAAIAGVLLMILAVAKISNPIAFVGPMAVFSFGGGLITPNAMVAAMTVDRTRVGTTISAYGALQMGGNALASSAIAATSSRSPELVGFALALLGLLTLLLAVPLGRSFKALTS